MSSAEKTIERQISTLALIGPFVILVALFIILIKTSFNYTYLPFAALIGIPLCYKWNMRGLAVSLSFLVLFFFYKYSDILPGDRLLHLGLATSLALTLFIIALSFKEIEGLWNVNRQQIKELQAIIQQRESQLKGSQEERTNEYHTLESQNLFLEQAGKEREIHLQLHEKTIAIMRKELAEAAKKQESLTEELFVRRNEVRRMHLNLQETQNEIQRLLTAQDSDANTKEILCLTEKLSLREKTISDLHVQLHDSSEKINSVTKRLEACSRELVAEQEINLDNKTLSEQVLKDQMLQQTVMQELQDYLETETREKELLEATLLKLQQERELLREQNEHHLNLIKSHEALVDFLKNTLKEQEHRFQHEKEKSDKAHAQFVEREQAILTANWTEAHQASRRNEGLYLQLRQQFLEKSIALDETRHELFHTHEQLLSLQLEQKEAFLNRSPIDKAMERHLIRMEREYAVINQEYAQEVDALHQLIETLLRTCSKSSIAKHPDHRF